MRCPRGSDLIKAESVSSQVHKQPACTHTAQNREGERGGERHRHREGDGGFWGRAAEIRKHHSVLNRGYVEVRKPQRALVLSQLSMREQVRGK